MRRPLVVARSAQPKWAIAKPADSAESPFRELELMELWDGTGKTRVRQHVNPLRRDFQTPAAAPDWSTVFADPSLPLALDIGSGYGRFLLLLQRTNPTQQVNYLGLEIRRTLVDRSNEWASRLGLRGRVHYIFANATVSLEALLGSYPGPVTDVFIQFPDPHFKRRHHKRRVVQPQLVAALKDLMAPGGRLLLQSDVEEVAAAMRNMFERYGSEAFELAPQHRAEGAVFFSGRPSDQGPVGEGGGEGEGQGQGQEQGPSGDGSTEAAGTAATVGGASQASAAAAAVAAAADGGATVSGREFLLHSATHKALDTAGDAAPAAAVPNYAAAAAGAARHAMAAAAAATAAVRQAERAAVSAAAATSASDDEEGPSPNRVGGDSGPSADVADSTSLYDTSGGGSSDGDSDDGGGGAGGGSDADADPDADISQMVSEWALGGWLVDNPIGTPTEREHYVEQQGLPVFRVALVRK